RKYIKPVFTNQTRNTVLFISLLLCIFVVYRVLNHLPYIDFRAYKIGTNIPEAMSIPPDAKPVQQEIQWIFEVDGQEQIIVTNGKYPAVNGTYIGVKDSKIIDPGYVPPILDFTIENEDENLIDEFMAMDKLIMVIVYNIQRTNEKGFENIKKKTDEALQKGYTVIGLSASINQPIERLKKDHDLNFDFYFCDQTVLKTIIRSNPAIMELQKGTIMQKAHWKDAKKIKL